MDRPQAPGRTRWLAHNDLDGRLGAARWPDAAIHSTHRHSTTTQSFFFFGKRERGPRLPEPVDADVVADKPWIDRRRQVTPGGLPTTAWMAASEPHDGRMRPSTAPTGLRPPPRSV